MIEELWKNSAIIAKRNVDSNQTPISVNLTELKQIIDVHSCLVLNQLPDEHYGIDIDGFTEVYDIEDVTTRSYKVDYANGVLYFHPNNIGKMLQVNYYGVGCTLLSASRIYTKYDKYGNVLETLEELLDKGKLYIQAIDALGGAVEVINRVENANATGTVLHENLLNDIEAGTPLEENLNESISEGVSLLPQLDERNSTATQKKTALDQSINSATNTNTILTNTNQSATQTNLTLQQTITSGQDSVNKINATGNKSIVIGASQFLNGEYTWQHNMNNDNLIVNFIDSATSEPLMADYKIIDKNNILIRNSAEHPNIKVILSASFYQGSDLFGTNVEEFAGDSIGTGAKKVRLKDGNGVVENPITDSDAIFMQDGNTRLTDKINGIDHNLTTKVTSYNSTIEVLDIIENIEILSQISTNMFYGENSLTSVVKDKNIYYVDNVYTASKILEPSTLYSKNEILKYGDLILKVVKAGTTNSQLNFYFDGGLINVGCILEVIDGEWKDTSLGFYINKIGHVKKNNTSTKKLVSIGNNILSLGMKSSLDAQYDMQPIIQSFIYSSRDDIKINNLSCYINNTIKIPLGKMIDFSNSLIALSTSFNGTKGYSIVVNSDNATDRNTNNQVKTNTILKNLNLENYYENNSKGIYLDCSVLLENVNFSGFNNDIVTSNNYNDSIIIDGYSTLNNRGSDYAIIRNGKGEIFTLKNVRTYTSKVLNILGNCYEVVLENIINGTYHIKNSSVSIRNAHIEIGRIILENTSASICDSFFYKTNGFSSIDSIQHFNGQPKPLYVSNVQFNMALWNEVANFVDGGDINISTNGDLTIVNCFRTYLPTDSQEIGDPYKNTLTGIKVFKNNTPFNEFIKHSGILSKNCIISNGMIENEINYKLNKTQIVDFIKPLNSEYHPNGLASGNYKYMAIISVDYNRKLMTFGQEKTINITSPSKVSIKIANNLYGCCGTLVLYRGVVGGNYNKLVEIPLGWSIEGIGLLDTGNAVNGYSWNNFTGASTIPLETVNANVEVVNYKNNLVNVEGYGKEPSVGVWEKGDIIYNTTSDSTVLSIVKATGWKSI